MVSRGHSARWLRLRSIAVVLHGILVAAVSARGESLTSIDSTEVLQQDLQAVRDFKPLGEEQMASLLERTAPAAADGKYELFKTTSQFDSTASNPQWLG